MKKLNNQQGFSIVEVSLIILVIALLAASGWFVYNRQQSSKPSATPIPTSSSTESPVATGVATSPTIGTTADLNRASALLDQTDPATSNASDTNLLNSQFSAF